MGDGKFLPAPEGAIVLSASQVDMVRPNVHGACVRKWAWRYVAGFKPQDSDAAKLGTEVDDEQIQPWLRDGRPFNFTKRKSAEIAERMRPHLPAPKTVEIQKPFLLPSATRPGLFYQGFMDIYAPLPGGSLVFPGLADELLEKGYALDDVVPGVGDTKTIKTLKRAKTPDKLAVDTQATIYAASVLYETRADAVDLVWPYGTTEGRLEAKRYHLRVFPEHVCEQFLKVDAVGAEVAELKAKAPPRSDEKAARDFVLSLPPSPDSCLAFGTHYPCPHVARCNLSPADSKTAALKAFEQVTWKGPKTMGNEATLGAFAKLRAAKAQAAPEPAPPPAEEPPAWLNEKKPYEPKHLGKGGTTEPPPAWTQRKGGLPGDADLKNPEAAAIGVNPPESKLPPAEDAPVPVPAPTEPAAPAAKRGGRKPKAAAEDDAPIPYALAQTVRVVWGAEKINPGNYQSIEVGPFEVTTSVQPGETIAQAIERVHGELSAAAERVRDAKVTAFGAK